MERRTITGEDVLPVSARFHNLGAGCLDLTLTCGDQKATIDGSDWLDPYPDMIAWLEDIVRGETLCRWRVQQEGSVTVHVCYLRKDGLSRFLSYRSSDGGTPEQVPKGPAWYDELCIDALIDPEQLVRAIYGSLRAFAASPDYDPKEWAYKSVAERLAELAPVNPAYEIERVLALPPEEFLKVIDELDPVGRWDGVYLYPWGAFPEAHRLMALIEEADPPIKAYFEPLINDCFYELPPEFETWPKPFRRACYEALLTGKVSFWTGEDLHKLRSEIIEGRIGSCDPPASGLWDPAEERREPD